MVYTDEGLLRPVVRRIPELLPARGDLLAAAGVVARHRCLWNPFDVGRSNE